MQRFNQLVFLVSLLALSWFAMMAFHEFGHVVGALMTGGTVERVVLHPLVISRTDVSPNPSPSVVVWLGPILGCFVPALVWWLIPRQSLHFRNIAMFFTGFCLIANGAYIGFGSFGHVGDCDVMLEHGSPLWTLLLFGATAVASGLYIWHRLGSIQSFLANPASIDPAVTYTLLGTLVLLLILEFINSPM